MYGPEQNEIRSCDAPSPVRNTVAHRFSKHAMQPSGAKAGRMATILQEVFLSMKHSKLITWLSAAVLGISAAVVCSAEITAKALRTQEGLVYSLHPDTHEIHIDNYNGSSNIVTVPATMANHPGYTVTVIGQQTFENTSVVEVNLPNTITEIGLQAFCGTRLTSMTLPESITHVDQYAFANCTALKTVKILGPTRLDSNAFLNCTALTDVILSDSSWTNRYYEAFVNCPQLIRVNYRTVLSYQKDSNGRRYPVLDESVGTAIRNHFSRSINVKFVNDYCEALCHYIVATETDPWMNNALMARQLHDWLVRHCQYEDRLNGESADDSENHVASSVFLSYALNVRGDENNRVGETVCEGYAKAYSMLLAAACIESYRIHSGGHEWNLVKIDGKYYQVDVTGDDPTLISGGDNTYGNPYSTTYTYFLKSNADTEKLHKNKYNSPTKEYDDEHQHPLLRFYSGDITNKLAQCTVSYPDANSDGILDEDYDLNGTASDNNDWNACNGMLRFSFGATNINQINSRMNEVLYHLHEYHKSYWNYIDDSTPRSVTIGAGNTAVFRVTLFGDSLYYQWMYYDTSKEQWININQPTTTSYTLSIPTTATTYGTVYVRCLVWNKHGTCIYSVPVTLTVL